MSNTTINKCECFACDIPGQDTVRIIKQDGAFIEQNADDASYLKDKITLTNESNNHCILQIKKNAEVKRPLQIINLLDGGKNSESEDFLTIVAEENSRITVLYCDDTLPASNCTVKHNVKVDMHPYSSIEFYKLENVNNQTVITSDFVFDLDNDSGLKTFFIALNGGRLTNNIRVNFNNIHSVADLNGLYLMDRQQSVETVVDIYHYKDSCKSNQLFKGILDDEAKANFLGHILVDYDAKNNDARQTNNNILLTDKAKVNTRPVLEIYNDDVQCSHGATTGQLDEQALYYLRTRGIGEKQAKMLLMNAFCQSVLQKSEIKELREGFSALIHKRLEGELSLENPFKISL